MANKDTEKKARGRFVDQPGQWVSTTPKGVKAKQQDGWNRLAQIMKSTSKPAGGSGKK